jgi:hypothetical protein
LSSLGRLLSHNRKFHQGCNQHWWIDRDNLANHDLFDHGLFIHSSDDFFRRDDFLAQCNDFIYRRFNRRIDKKINGLKKRL